MTPETQPVHSLTEIIICCTVLYIVMGGCIASCNNLYWKLPPERSREIFTLTVIIFWPYIAFKWLCKFFIWICNAIKEMIKNLKYL